MTITKESKRIQSVIVKRIVDSDGDTSWLGEYGRLRASVFSIDRAHSEDCQSLSESASAGIETLERVIEYLVHQSQYASKDGNHDLYSVYDESADLLIKKQDELAECDCGESGDMNRGEYQFFNPSSNYVDANDNLVDGNTAEEVRKYVRQDYERMEDLNRGGWCFVGVVAEAKIQLERHGVIQTITSGGLWGIESDSGDYFKEVEAEQLSELRGQLHAIGFSKRAISAAFRNVEHNDE